MIMDEVDYSVPKDESELEQLVGKSVGVIYFGHKKVEPLVLLQREPFPGEIRKPYEFIRQCEGARGIPTMGILGLVVFPEDLDFLADGVRLNSSLDATYMPQGQPEMYEERLQLLKQNKLWRSFIIP